MRQQIRLTESELQNIIEESVRRVIAENMENEGFFGDLWKAGKNAFGGDVNRAKAAAQQTGTNIRNGIQNVKQGVQNGYNNVRQGVQKRANAFGASMNASKNQRYAENAVKALQQLQQMTTYNNDPVFGPNSKTGQAVAQTLRMLNGALKGRIAADRTAWAAK